MTITVNIYYKGQDGSARKFAKEMLDMGIVDKIRAKTGNLRYEYFLPMDDSETVLLIDEWANQEALDEHHASELMPIIADLRNKYDLHMTVERYISDEAAGDRDEQFIRK